MKLTVYTPQSSIHSPRKLFKEMFQDLVRSRDLAWRLAVRDINSQYRQSKLGMIWAFLMPLASTITWIFLNMSGIIAIGKTDIPYPLYVFIGTLLWSVFMESLFSPLTMTNNAKSVLSKINFPREAIIISGFYQVLFNSAIKLLLIVGVVAMMGFLAGWQVLMFPVAILVLIITGMAAGLFLTPIGMLYTDIGRGVSLVMQFGMFITPVIFPIPASGWVRIPFIYNPVTPLIMTARSWLTGTTYNFIPGFLIVTGLMLMLLMLSWIIYRITMPIIIERMSS